VETWDTALLTWLRNLERRCAALGIAVDRSRLPGGIARLLELAAVVVEPESEPERRPSVLARVGAATVRAATGVVEVLGFIGRVVLALARLVTLRARFRLSDLQQLLMNAGADAVPITTLVSVIVGLILAFVGAIQLRLFGADLYVADLVAVAMVREMGAMVVAIIMAGRTGAAYAAQLSTMKVTEEIDALRTFGISTVEFLVLPRVVALFLMMPFLCLYSVALGIVGGAVVGVYLLGIAPQLYLDQTLQAVTLTDLYGGLLHGCVYGLLVGIVGCQRGLSAGNDAGAVGAATTSAVVASLVAIVVADGVIAVVFDTLGI
jgi:phospholipid/cholesterol/gamma-HCH transport system permease protein